MKKYIILMLLLFVSNSAFADIIRYPSTTYNSFYPKFNQQNKISTSHYSPARRYHRKLHTPNFYYNNYLSDANLNALEKHAFNKTFGRNRQLERLERLENVAFGAIQDGDLITRYQNVEQAILSRPQYKTKQSVLSNIANYLGGQTTGFTPSLIPYSSIDGYGSFSTNPSMYSPKYSTTKFEQYSNGIFGGGWGMSNGNFGSGSSIKILD